MKVKSLSVVVPLFNEVENLPVLLNQLDEALGKSDRFCARKYDYEIILVDDGSTDGTVDLCQKLAADDSRLKLVLFRRNFGQTAAMQAGIDHSCGDVIVTMDGDLQNDPADIPMMIAKIESGYDLVHGWRRNRKDGVFLRKIPSKAANWLISKTTGFPIHDLGCTLKAIRQEIAFDLDLFGEMHRFIPIIAYERGAKCIEVETRHHARQHGRSKYGIGRTPRVVLDLVTVKFLLKYFASPMKLFGMIGLGCMSLGFISGLATVGMKLASGVDMTGNPLFMLTALACILGIQFISLGLLGEVNARIYFGSQGKKHYAVRKVVNFEEASEAEKSVEHRVLSWRERVSSSHAQDDQETSKSVVRKVPA